MNVEVKTGSVDAVPVLIATCMVTSIGALIFNTMPVLLGTIAETRGFGEAALSTFSTAILLGALTGVLAALSWINRVRWRPTMTLIALVGIGVALLLPFAHSVFALAGALGVMGFLMGSLYSPALAALGGAGDPVRAFGVSLILQVSISALVAYFLPSYLLPLLGEWSITAVLVTTSLIVVLTYPILPMRQTPATDVSDETREPVTPAPSPIAGLLALGTMTIFYLGIMGIWQFLERLGVSWGLEQSFVGAVIAVALLVGAAGAILPVIVGERFGLLKPFILAFALLGGAVLCFLAPHTSLIFAAGAILLNVGWNSAVPFVYSVVAESDPSGRLIVSTVIVQMIGAFLGAAAAGMILTQWGFGGLFGFFAACLAIALSLHVLSIRSLRHGGGREVLA